MAKKKKGLTEIWVERSQQILEWEPCIAKPVADYEGDTQTASSDAHRILSKFKQMGIPIEVFRREDIIFMYRKSDDGKVQIQDF